MIRMLNRYLVIAGVVMALCLVLRPPKSYAYTANKVHFFFLASGIYRVTVEYTIPEIREFREADIEFTNFAEANKFYWDVVRGADFYWTDPDLRKYIQNTKKPQPW